jgi:hypothetical protein
MYNKTQLALPRDDRMATPVVYNKTLASRTRGSRTAAPVVYNKTLASRTATTEEQRSRITKPMKGGRPTTEPKGTLVAVRLSGRQVHALEGRSRREATGLSEALRRCLDEWAAAQDAVPTQPKQEAVKKQRATVGTHPTRRRTRRTTK